MALPVPLIGPCVQQRCRGPGCQLPAAMHLWGSRPPCVPTARSVRCAIVIPTYNTGSLVLRTVADALASGLPVHVTVDGSDDGTAEALEAMAVERGPILVVHRHPRNLGKGAAVLTAARAAAAAGFTHVLTFDADGQHPADAIPRYVAAAEAHPQALVLGSPVFDASAPLERVVFRRLATFGLSILTGFAGIRDALFGMRLFPLAPLLEVMDATRAGRRYDFESVAAVRLVWRGHPVVDLPTPVRYPDAAAGGVSHYRYVRDNVRLVALFFTLLPGALCRLPVLLRRRLAGTSRLTFPA